MSLFSDVNYFWIFGVCTTNSFFFFKFKNNVSALYFILKLNVESVHTSCMETFYIMYDTHHYMHV